MKAFINFFYYYYQMFCEVFSLKRLHIHLGSKNSTSTLFFNKFNRPHEKLWFVKSKTIGVCIVRRNDFNNFDEYISHINGKNSAAYYYRKCLKRGYIFKETDPNQFADDIFEVDTSTEVRGGKKMAQNYFEKKTHYSLAPEERFFCILAPTGKLVCYLKIAIIGEAIIFCRLLGHKDKLNDGVMYCLLVSFFQLFFSSEFQSKYVVYDTFFGASEGLKMFKRKLAFVPYRVKWEISQ